jgi:sialic acid synthase SpsE
MGSLDRARELVRAAHDAGMDAVKFQVIDANQLSDASVTYPVIVKGRETRVNMKEMFEKLHFSESDWAQIARACRSHGIDFFATVDYLDGVDMLERLEVPAHKIGAWDCTFRPLIERIGATHKPMFVDLGPTTVAEIEEIVHWYRSAGGTAVLFLHDFHTPDDTQMNLRAVQYLNDRVSWPAGFSAPGRDDDLDFAALALGACCIEKRLILSRSDFAFHAHESMEPNELKGWVARIRHVERALGAQAILPSDKDRELSTLYYRSVCTLTAVKAGDALSAANLGAKRPGIGIPTSRLPQIWGRCATHDIAANVLITDEDFS